MSRRDCEHFVDLRFHLWRSGCGQGRHGQNSGPAGGGRGQLAFHTICEDPHQPGDRGSSHTALVCSTTGHMQHCSAAAGAAAGEHYAVYIHIVTVSSYAVARRTMNSNRSAAQQTGNCELELELAGEGR